MSDSLSPEVAARARKIRRAGYLFFGCTTLWLMGSILISAPISIDQGEVWDPYSGELHSVEIARCDEEGENILRSWKVVEEGKGEGVADRFLLLERRAEGWVLRCERRSKEIADQINGRRKHSEVPI